MKGEGQSREPSSHVAQPCHGLRTSGSARALESLGGAAASRRGKAVAARNRARRTDRNTGSFMGGVRVGAIE